MYLKLLYLLIGVGCLVSKHFWPSVEVRPQKPELSFIQKIEFPAKPVKIPSIKEVPIKKIKTSNALGFKKIDFEQLPGWDKADVKKSLLAFQKSCETFIKQNPSHPVGSNHIHLKAGDWRPACKAALSLKEPSEDVARLFFEKWFNPIKLENKSPGLFTGYYMPQFKGSLTKTKTFNTPVYGLPKGSKHNYYTRAQIDNGALKEKAPVIAWMNSPIERLSLEIEGSGVIKLPNGKRLFLNYAGENGAPYTSVGGLLIKNGIMTRSNASMKAIKHYMKKNPVKANSILQQNKSFVFFQDLKKPVAIGARGIPLTPGYSLAIDRKWIPLGMPLWLTTRKPSLHKKATRAFQRLMVAQDTGGAIRGLMRGDIYWGAGKKAAILGEQMRDKGRFWLLLPKYMKLF